MGGIIKQIIQDLPRARALGFDHPMVSKKELQGEDVATLRDFQQEVRAYINEYS